MSYICIHFVTGRKYIEFFFFFFVCAKVAKDVVVIKCENPPADTAGDDMDGMD